MTRSSEVAAKNPFAWFPDSRSAESIATPSDRNRITAEPYTKCMNSFAGVDFGAALLVTNLEVAREAGLEDQCVYPWAGSTTSEVPLVSRPDLGRSQALRLAAEALFAAAGKGIDDMDVIDIYSCFPLAVQVGAIEIGLDLDDPRGLTVTGGMSFFGGPGNNYASHSIVGVAQKIREGAANLGYVSGNGGMLSKHSLGIYGSAPPDAGYKLADTSAQQREINAGAIEATSQASGAATVEGNTVVYDREGQVTSAPVVATLDDGRRVRRDGQARDPARAHRAKPRRRDDSGRRRSTAAVHPLVRTHAAFFVLVTATRLVGCRERNDPILVPEPG